MAERPPHVPDVSKKLIDAVEALKGAGHLTALRALADPKKRKELVLALSREDPTIEIDVEQFLGAVGTALSSTNGLLSPEEPLPLPPSPVIAPPVKSRFPVRSIGVVLTLVAGTAGAIVGFQRCTGELPFSETASAPASEPQPEPVVIAPTPVPEASPEPERVRGLIEWTKLKSEYYPTEEQPNFRWVQQLALAKPAKPGEVPVQDRAIAINCTVDGLNADSEGRFAEALSLAHGSLGLTSEGTVNWVNATKCQVYGHEEMPFKQCVPDICRDFPNGVYGFVLTPKGE